LLISSRQAQIYRIWANLNNLDVFPVTSRHHHARQKVKATAFELGITPEAVRKTIAKVLIYLNEGGELPPEADHCYRCQGTNIQQLPDTKAGNRQFYCLSCEKAFVLQTQNNRIR
jgi:hypothetical protein